MLPTFETERLFIRPRTMKDFEDCITMDRDPDVTKFLPGPWNDDDRHRRFLTERMTTDFGDNLGYWSIFEKSNPDRFLGWVLLIPHNAAGPDVEIGWRFNRHVWGKGIATEAAKPVLAHGFHTSLTDRIIADIDPANEGSKRVAEKIGFKPIGENLENGHLFLSYVLTRAEFSPHSSKTS
ncbi:GNAT family N-acetyltransferase [Phyllobacterium sp. YR531]|uniref:GNAT family N-acetyltransferase n=1 Tax=Phyllobacterium sp. YR531 TaxID=1144343 RepID=UPI00026FCCA4|nr:GNAT family N-acetyltransferase [Phyllobacterium sp. YR531]EJM99478.1 acetyltransferase, ribosomal protein N-acetylase [Phyllobacterium sp. YR531]